MRAGQRHLMIRISVRGAVLQVLQVLQLQRLLRSRAFLRKVRVREGNMRLAAGGSREG